MLISRDVANSCSKEMFPYETDRFITVDSHFSSVTYRSELQLDKIHNGRIRDYPLCFSTDISQMTGISSIFKSICGKSTDSDLLA